MNIDGPLPSFESTVSGTQGRITELLRKIKGMEAKPMREEVKKTLGDILALPTASQLGPLRAMAEALVGDIVKMKDVNRALVHFSEKDLIPKLIDRYCKHGKKSTFSFRDAVARLVESQDLAMRTAILNYVPLKLREIGMSPPPLLLSAFLF